MLKFLGLSSIYFIGCIMIQDFAAPITPSMIEFTFGDGCLHGISWLGLLFLIKFFGAPICVFADFHTWGYIIGFILGVAGSILIFLVLFFISLFSS